MLIRQRNTVITAGSAIRRVPPAAMAVSVDDLKEQARVTSDSEISVLLRLAQAATTYVEEYTGLGLITQTWEQRFSSFPDVIVLARRPVQSIVRVDDLTVGSPFTTSDASSYALAGANADHGAATVSPVNGASWPAISGVWSEAVAVTYVVGFGDAPAAVPETLRHAVLLLATLWFDDRDAPDHTAVKALLADWRPEGIA